MPRFDVKNCLGQSRGNCDVCRGWGEQLGAKGRVFKHVTKMIIEGVFFFERGKVLSEEKKEEKDLTNGIVYFVLMIKKEKKKKKRMDFLGLCEVV